MSISRASRAVAARRGATGGRRARPASAPGCFQHRVPGVDLGALRVAHAGERRRGSSTGLRVSPTITPSITSTGLPSTVSLVTLMSLNASPRGFSVEADHPVEQSRSAAAGARRPTRQTTSASSSAPIAAQADGQGRRPADAQMRARQGSQQQLGATGRGDREARSRASAYLLGDRPRSSHPRGQSALRRTGRFVSRTSRPRSNGLSTTGVVPASSSPAIASHSSAASAEEAPAAAMARTGAFASTASSGRASQTPLHREQRTVRPPGPRSPA